MPISINLQTMELSGEPGDVSKFMDDLARLVSEQEMADLACVSVSTIKKWKTDPRFTRVASNRVTRKDFYSFLFAQKINSTENVQHSS